MAASAPATPPSPGPVGITTITRRAIATPMAPRAPASSTEPDTSDLHHDDLAHPQRPNHHQHPGADQHAYAERGGVERTHVARPGKEQPAAHEQRQPDQDVSGQPSLRAECPNMAAQAR